jgi:hypothetical protein
MNFILFNTFSTLENIGIILIMLSLFKYRVLDYLPQILLTSSILSLISHTMRFELSNSNLVPFIVILTLFLFVWIAFRVSVFYALIITIVGFIASALLQLILLFIIELTELTTLNAIETPYSIEGYSIQFMTSILAFLLSFLLRRKNYGFNWVPYSKTAKFKLKGDNIILFLVTIVSVFTIGLLFYLYLSGYIHLLAIFVLFSVLMFLLFYLSGKKEEKYYD